MENKLLNKLIDNNELLFYIISIFKNRRFMKAKNNKLKRELFIEDFYGWFDDFGTYGYCEINDDYEIRLVDEKNEAELFDSILQIIKINCTKNDARFFLDKVLKYNNKMMTEFTRDNNLNYQNTLNAYHRVVKIVRNEIKNK